MFDVGQAIAATSTDSFAPYKVQAWDKIPDTAKDANGAYYADYTGIMSVAGMPISTVRSTLWTICSIPSSPARCP